MEGRGYGGYHGRGSGGSGGGRGRGRHGGGGNGGRGRNGGGGGGGGGGRGGGYGPGRNGGGGGGGGGYEQNYQTQYNEVGGRGGNGRGRGYDNRAPQQQGGSGGSAVGRGVWTGKPWGSPSPSSSTGQTSSSLSSSTGQTSSSPSSSTGQTKNQVWRQPQIQSQSAQQSTPSADFAGLSFQSLKITEPSQSLYSPEKRILPMRRPDLGTLSVRSVRIFVNHFPVTFNPRSIIMHYDVDIKQVSPGGNQAFNKTIPKHLLRSIKEKLFSRNSNFPVDMVAYDGEKNIFSAVELPIGQFSVEFSEGGDSASSYTFTIKEVSRLELNRLKEYLGGRISYIPRDILQGMDLVMKENPSKFRISAGRSFYCKNYRGGDDLRCGVAVHRGFSQSLKHTSQGLALCLDYSVLTFRKPMPVLDFLKENIEDFRVVDDVLRLREDVTMALKGLKVTVTHRITKQKYIISGLTKDSTRELTFPLLGPDSDSQASPRQIQIVDYFRQKYGKNIKYLNIPCLNCGKPGKPNNIPMEFCVLVEGQRYPKEQLDKDRAGFLKRLSLADPAERKSTILEMVQAEDGPCGIVSKNFNVEVEKNMTSVEGRVLGAPQLKLRAANGNIRPFTVDQEKCHWNLVGKSVVEGQHVERWAVIDFTSTSRGRFKLYTDEFINNLMQRAYKLGVHMEEPLACHLTGMHEFSSVARIEKLLGKVIDDAGQNGGLQGKKLQVIVCIMTEKHHGYNYLKWVSETKVGVLTQCCLSPGANKGQDQYLANLCLKINAKVGGSNVELIERLPHFVTEDNVMFIGADVNHPAARNSTCPSIAAVVGTINWPAANRYAARIQPQEHRKEKIVNFGSICRDLVNTFAQHNKCRPKKIVVFRDGVSEGQFDMVLNEELLDLIQAISSEQYRPTITIVVAQKRHQTRLFNDRRDGVGNVPPGTVVDTTIVHPFEFDFYLCSHYGSIGTSKPTHYYVLWDENRFTSDELQKLIYNLCFTYARCTKPVSLVPPVYYADLVAYRGRLFQEVVMEQFSAPSRPTGMASASSSASAASFDQNFYNLHRDLQNVMHFV